MKVFFDVEGEKLSGSGTIIEEVWKNGENDILVKYKNVAGYFPLNIEEFFKVFHEETYIERSCWVNGCGTLPVVSTDAISGDNELKFVERGEVFVYNINDWNEGRYETYMLSGSLFASWGLRNFGEIVVTEIRTILAANGVQWCELCGSLHNLDYTVGWFYNHYRGGYVCDACAAPRECYYCGSNIYGDTCFTTWITANDTENAPVCPDCQRIHRTFWCTECDVNYISDGDDRYRDGRSVRSNAYLCPDHDHDISLSTIRSYDYVPMELRFTDKDVPPDACAAPEKEGVRYIGVEQEMDCGDTYSFCQHVGGCAEDYGYHHLFYFMHDGSLDDGVEVTTVPLALDYALDGYPFDWLHEQATKFGMRADMTRTCGLHIHVNRNSIGSTEQQHELIMAKVVFAFDKFYDELLRFARRSKASAERWCNKPNARINPDDSYYEQKEKMMVCKDHYKAINLLPSSTVEFRLWKGSHNPETVRVTIDFTSAILDFCEETPLDTLYTMSWDTFANGVLTKCKRCDNVKEYMVRRGLIERSDV